MANILIVEDEKALSDAYQTILESHGHTTKSAGNGQEALDVLKSEKPDVILLDMKMPKMNGLEFLRAFEGKDDGPAIVIFSNLDNREEIDEAFRLGARHYILKAWASPQDLVKVVQEALVK